MLEHVQELAKDRGAHVIHSNTGVANAPSLGLHAKFGFQPMAVSYQLLLGNEDDLRANLFGHSSADPK